jgi:hypothetical protein
MRVPQQSSRLVGRRQLRFCADAGEEVARGGRARRPRSTSFSPSRGQRKQFDIDEAAREMALCGDRSRGSWRVMSWPLRARCLPSSAPGAAAAPCHPAALLVSERGEEVESRGAPRKPGGGEEQHASQRSCGSSACGARRPLAGTRAADAAPPPRRRKHNAGPPVRGGERAQSAAARLQAGGCAASCGRRAAPAAAARALLQQRSSCLAAAPLSPCPVPAAHRRVAGTSALVLLCTSESRRAPAASMRVMAREKACRLLARWPCPSRARPRRAH